MVENKKKHVPRHSIQLPDEIDRRIVQRAKENHRSINAEVRFVLMHGLSLLEPDMGDNDDMEVTKRKRRLFRR